MKTKTHSRHHVSIHQQLERLAHHRLVLSVVVSVMLVGFLKYETQFLKVLHEAYNQGFGLIGTYAHHDEITRMPVQYGPGVRNVTTSGE